MGKIKKAWEFIWKYKWIIIIVIIFVPSILFTVLKHIVFEYSGFCLDTIPWINKIDLLRMKFDNGFPFSSILEIIALVFVGREIKSVRQNLIIKNNFKTADSLSSFIGDTIYRLSNENVLVNKGKISDETCRQNISKILMLLSETKPDEQNLINCLNRYKTEDIHSIPEWITEIGNYGRKVIINYKTLE
jgi:hypothetical protein